MESDGNPMGQKKQYGGEILSLQFGPFSNYVGTHLWNLRDEALGRSAMECSQNSELVPLDLTCLYRTTMGKDQRVTHVPRLLLFDSQHSLGSLKPHGNLYSFGQQMSREEHMAGYSSAFKSKELAALFGSEAWGGQVDAFFQPPAQRSSFQTWLEDQEAPLAKQQTPPSVTKLETEIQSWPDFLKVQYHPKTIQLLPKQMDEEFQLYTAGKSLTTDTRIMDEYVENMRQFLEECDRIQAVYCTVDIDSGYGSLAHAMLEEFRSEARSASVMTFGVLPESQSNAETALKQGVRRVNEALATSDLTAISSLYVPINLEDLSVASLPNLDESLFRPKSAFHQSAVVAVAIESVVRPFNNMALKLQQFVPSIVHRPELNISSVSAAIPWNSSRDSSEQLNHPALMKKWLEESIVIQNNVPPTCIHMTALSSSYLRNQYSAVASGMQVTADYPLSPQKHTFGQLVTTHLGPESAPEIENLRQVMKEHSELSPTLFAETFDAQLPVSLCFPAMFHPEVVEQASGDSTLEQPYDIAVVGCLENSTMIASDLRRVAENARAVPAPVALQFSKTAHDLAEEDWLDVRQRVSFIAEAYADGM